MRTWTISRDLKAKELGCLAQVLLRKSNDQTMGLVSMFIPPGSYASVLRDARYTFMSCHYQKGRKHLGCISLLLSTTKQSAKPGCTFGS